MSVLLAIATLNREHFVLSDKLRKTQRAAAKKETMSVDQLAAVTVKSHDGLFEVDAGSRLDATVDAVDSWIFEAVDGPLNGPSPPDLAVASIMNMRRFGGQRAHFDLWQQALWEDWRLGRHEEQWVFIPGDWDMAALQDAWLHRKESNFMGYVWIDQSTWPLMQPAMRRSKQLSLTVIGVEQRAGKRRRLVVGRPPITHMSAYAIAQAGLEGTYVNAFLTRALPKYADLSCALLLRAWHVLSDLTKVLAAERSRPTFTDFTNVRQWALVVRRSELVETLARALSVSDGVATQAIDFLSWSKGTYKGLWGAPFVPLPGQSDQLAIAASVLTHSNLVRTVEIWMTKGGLDDQLSKGSKGRSFEAELRADVREELKGNAVVRDTACAEHAVKKGPDFPEEIDLLVRFGTILLVGEVKCFLYPADSRERFNFLRNLRGACDQASRKAIAIGQRMDVAARALGISEADAQLLQVVPIVVLNQGYGMSLVSGNCVVTDAKFLKLYLGSATYTSEGAVNVADGGMATTTRSLYRDAAEAVTNFESTMRSPPPLHRFRSLLRWTSFAFPTTSGGALQIAQTELGQLPDATRKLYETMKAAVEA